MEYITRIFPNHSRPPCAIVQTLTFICSPDRRVVLPQQKINYLVVLRKGCLKARVGLISVSVRDGSAFAKICIYRFYNQLLYDYGTKLQECYTISY